MISHKESYQPAFGYAADTPPKRLLENLVNRSGGLALGLLVIISQRKKSAAPKIQERGGKARTQRFRIARKKSATTTRVQVVACFEAGATLLSPFSLRSAHAHATLKGVLRGMPNSPTAVVNLCISSAHCLTGDFSKATPVLLERRNDTQFTGCDCLHGWCILPCFDFSHVLQCVSLCGLSLGFTGMAGNGNWYHYSKG